MKATSPLNRFGARYKTKDGSFVYEKDWKSRETGQCHTAEKGEVYPYGYDPTFYPHRLNEPFKVKKPAKIFVVDTGDIFGSWVPEEWIIQILNVVRQCSWHTFQFLTKNSERLIKYDFPDNAWVGTSVNSDKDIKRVKLIKQAKAKIKYLSIEPLLGPVTFDLNGVDWIIIGAQTGKNPSIPKTEWIDEIIKQSNKYKIPVFFKENIKKYSNYFVQQFP